MASSVGGDHRRRGQRRLGRPANFLRALGLALGSAVIDLDLGTGSPTLVLASVFDDELRPGAAPAESLRGHRGVGAARGLTVLTTRTVPAGEAGHPHHFSVGYSRLAGQRSGPHTCRWFLLARAVASTETIGIGQARKARCRAPGTAGGGGADPRSLTGGRAVLETVAIREGGNPPESLLAARGTSREPNWCVAWQNDDWIGSA